MMVGSNDKQAIRENGKTLAFGTPDWTAAYGRRVGAIDEAFRTHGIPLIWVGVPITKDDGFADAMASLNDITREAAGKTRRRLGRHLGSVLRRRRRLLRLRAGRQRPDRQAAGVGWHPFHQGRLTQAGAFRGGPRTAGA